ncbi:exo-beta-N-acetylmuramidase NamZ domain-containing protein [Azospira restricta]|uniref:DUF1343 domain-containing protein n=1 Tax=Azospira restricta TaxID=404405 RepID=A0A974SRB1_9RHOO|nr:exo-beta-N-acetylmuramidase NamZ domain-containing protein [Azospira restricta]QRJ65037.1 DUF1343 domain-containing protein [Azospira restricta]
MKRLLPLLGLFVAALAGAQPHLDVERLAPIAGIVEAEIAAGRIPGAVVLVGQRERIVYAQAFGQRALAPEAEPMTLDTVFDLASLTKVVATTPAVLRLAERGRLQLDAPAARYWPAFATHGKERISVRQLLAHTSGLPAGIDLAGAATPAAALARLAAVKPLSPPGGDPRYSDANFAVLGELVRRVSGQPLAAYVERQILRPLAMHDSGFLPPARLQPRLAPTTGNGRGLRRGEVHDPLAARLGGAAGNAGLFASAGDLARFARALLAGGAPILQPASVAAMFSPQTHAAAPPRGLGWRLEAPLAANRAALPPFAAASHLGYTGTGLWLDPLSGVHVVVLSSRLHPDGNGDASSLRARVVAAVAAALGPQPPQLFAAARPELAARVAPYVPKAVAAPVRAGIDVLAAAGFAPLAGLRVGLLTNRSGVDAAGRRSVDVLAAAPGVALVALFSPEHGLAADREGRVGDERDALTGLPVYSLYGATRRPTAAMLDGLDALVVDLADAGVRFYTYATTLAYVLEAAAERNLPVFVLDRPNPLAAGIAQGPALDAGRQSFTGYWPLPLRHGLTLGEFARLFVAEAGLAVRLSVVPLAGYRRGLWHDDTGLPWLPPSPNLLSLAAATLYPAVGLVEGAAVSVGRGTDAPFEQLGAPWIDGRQLAAELDALALPGVRFVPTEFVPATSRYAGEPCHGVRIEVLDRAALDSPQLGVALASVLHRLYPQHFALDKILGNLGSEETLAAIRAGQAPAAIAAGWAPALADFRARAAPFLLYAD